MFNRKKIIGIFLLLSIELYAEVIAQVHQKVYDFVKKQKARVPNPVQVEEGLVYAFCKDEGSTPVLEANCTIISGSTPDNLRFCNVTVQSTARQLIRDFFDVRGFGKDKVILQWEEEAVGKFSVPRYGVVNLTNCELRLIADSISDADLSITAPITDHIFDVIYQNSNYCDHWCRVTLDDKGNVLANPRHNLNSSEYVSISYSPTKGRLVVILPLPFVKENVIQVASEDINGTLEILKEFPVERGLYKYTVSVTYDLLTVCSAVNLYVYCGQFDNNGRLKFEKTTRIHNQVHQLNEIKVLNTLNGGYLLLINGGYHEQVLSLMATPGGRPAGTFELPKFEYQNLASDFRLFVNKDKQNCLTTMNEDEHHLTFNIICFPRTHL